MKAPIATVKSYEFYSDTVAKALRAVAQWVMRHPDVYVVSIALNRGIWGATVTLTVEEL